VINARNEADQVMYEVEKLLKEHDAKIGGAEKEQIKAAIERTKQAASKDEVQAIKQAVSDLKVAAQSLAQYVQGGAGQGPTPETGPGPTPGKGGPDDVIDAEFEVKK
jgi:molecular chaperone DnaK